MQTDDMYDGLVRPSLAEVRTFSTGSEARRTGSRTEPRWRIAILAQIACSVFLVSKTSFGDTPLVVVDRFDQAVQNELDGYRSVFQRLPSRASALRVREPQRGVGGHSMRIAATKADAGFCGYWLHLFDMNSPRPVYFDARDFSYLSFWVRGARGGETFDIRLADANWIAKEDSVLLGRIDQFLDSGVTQEWQEVLVPLRAARLDWSRLGGLTLDFATAGEFTIYLEDVTFKTARDVTLPPTNLPPHRADVSPPGRAMWLWSTADLLSDQRRWRELFDFCDEHRIDQLWMQLPYDVETTKPGELLTDDATQTTTVRIEIQKERKLRKLLALAHARGVQVHALDGAPELCLKANHAIPLGVVDAVLRFNSQGEPRQRFDGVHFDNEPYLLLGWNLPSRREQILREYLELNAECQRRVREQSEMQFGVDIPFWWQAVDKATGQCHAAVEFQGVRKAASFHCIDMLDNVGVMNYRDTADGADGMIAHGRDLIAYGQQAERATVYMGVETFAYANQPVWFLVGIPREDFLRAMSRPESLANHSRIGGHRIRLLDDGEHIHIGIEIPREMSDQQSAAAKQALRSVAETLGFLARNVNADVVASRRSRATAAIESDGQWRGFQVRDLPATSDAATAPGFVTESVMLSKVTFADNTAREFDVQVSAAEDYFRDFECYGGLAIHFYETYRALRDSSQPE